MCIARIRQITEQNTSYSAYRKLIRAEFPELDTKFSIKPLSYAANLWLYLHEMTEPPVCGVCGNSVPYVDRSVGFRPYCSSKCSANSNIVKEKRGNTNMQRYGVDNILSAPDTREKRNNTMLERYGSVHPLQNATLKEKANKSNEKIDRIAVRKQAILTCREKYGVDNYASLPICKERIRKTNLEKYGVTSPLIHHHKKSHKLRRDKFISRMTERLSNANLQALFDDPLPVGMQHPFKCLICLTEFTAHMDNGSIPRCLTCYPGGSNLEKEIVACIKSFGFEPELQNRDIIQPKQLDIVIPEINFAIEVNGTYWHSDEKVVRNYHLDKTKECEAKGFRLIHIFEEEWLSKREIVMSRLSYILGSYDRILYARKGIIKIVSGRESNAFLQENHIQGQCPSKFNYGLFYDDELMAVMTFGNNRFGGLADVELLRFATKKNVRIIGAASRLLAAFDREHNYPKLISYSDKRWNAGNLYLALGFKFSHSSSPSYTYHGNGKILSRYQCQKHKLRALLSKFDENMSEHANMRSNGYHRIYDCGTDVYIRL